MDASRLVVTMLQLLAAAAAAATMEDAAAVDAEAAAAAALAEPAPPAPNDSLRRLDLRCAVAGLAIASSGSSTIDVTAAWCVGT